MVERRNILFASFRAQRSGVEACPELCRRESRSPALRAVRRARGVPGLSLLASLFSLLFLCGFMVVPPASAPVINLGTATGSFTVPWTVPGTTVILGYSGSTPITATLPTNVPAGVYNLIVNGPGGTGQGIAKVTFTPAPLLSDGTAYNQSVIYYVSGTTVLSLLFDGSNYHLLTPPEVGSIGIASRVQASYPGAAGVGWIGGAVLSGAPLIPLSTHIASSLFALNTVLGAPFYVPSESSYYTNPLQLDAVSANVEGSPSCSTAPKLALVDCGATAGSCASPTTLALLTLPTAAGWTAATGLAVNLAATHWIAWEFTAGVCATPPTVDAAASLQTQ